MHLHFIQLKAAHILSLPIISRKISWGEFGDNRVTVLMYWYVRMILGNENRMEMLPREKSVKGEGGYSYIIGRKRNLEGNHPNLSGCKMRCWEICIFTLARFCSIKMIISLTMFYLWSICEVWHPKSPVSRYLI